MRRHGLLPVALLADLIGAAGALLVTLRTWQVVTVPRERPQPDVVSEVTGRSLDSAITALALVALAGVVAVLALRGLPRRLVGVVLALAGGALVWRAGVGASAVDASRARSLAAGQHRAATLGTTTPRVEVHAQWPVLAAVFGVLVLVAGVLVAWRGHRWQAMSVRYESRPDREADPARVAGSMWSALDRGHDPTDDRADPTER